MSEKKERNIFKEYYPTRKEAREMFKGESLVPKENRELYTLSDGSIYNAKTDTVTQMIKFDDAVEVLAKWMVQGTVSPAPAWEDVQFLDWDNITEEQKQQYRIAARKELGK